MKWEMIVPQLTSCRLACSLSHRTPPTLERYLLLKRIMKSVHQLLMFVIMIILMFNSIGCIEDDTGGAETRIQIQTVHSFTENPMQNIVFDLIEDTEGFSFASQEFRLETLITDTLGNAETSFITKATKKYELRYLFNNNFWPNSTGIVEVAEGEINIFEFEMKDLIDIDVQIAGGPSNDYNRVQIRIINDDGLYFGQTWIRDIITSIDTTVVYRGASVETANIEIIYYMNSEMVSTRKEILEIGMETNPVINVNF